MDPVTELQMLVLFLVFIRIASFFAVVPFLTMRGVPNLLKIGLAGLTSYLIYPTVGLDAALMSEGLLNHILLISGEVVVGLVLGYVVLLVFLGIRIAGQMVDMQMGLLMASVFDPQFGSPVTLMGQFYYLLGTVFFFVINGHHSLLAALAGSFKIVPPGLHMPADATVWSMMELFYWIFILAFQIALPIVAVLLMVDVSLGLVAKTVPQLQVFMVGLPLKLGVGMLTLIMVIPLMAAVFENVFNGMVTEMFKIMGTF